MELGRVLFLSGVVVTHALVGYALVRGFTDADPRLGIVFGVFPDADVLFPAWGWPFVHRGLTHSPAFALAVALGAAALARDRTVGVAVGLAVGAHVAIDALGPEAVPLLFPLRATWTPGLPVHGPAGTALLWTASIAVLARRTDAISSVTAVIGS